MLPTFKAMLPAGRLLALVLLAGCAQQPASPPSDDEALASSYPETGKLAIPSRASPRGVTSEARLIRQEDVAENRRDAADDSLTTVEVWRSSRYQLVTTRATLGQRDLLEQMVSVRIPASINATVEDALRHTLRHTGFTLCPPQGTPQSLLYGSPLPAVHRHLGPMPLREALTVLAGSTWEVQVDPIARLVCYQVRDTLVAGHPSVSL